jgi:cytochrome c-type biogenesis protein CcmF
MIVELGHFALILAFAVALVQTIVPLVGAHKGWPGLDGRGGTRGHAQFLLVAFSFAALTWAFVTSDFSVAGGVNSHTLKPMIYKISGVWGNHEGSLLLWVLILALFGACAAWFGGNLPPRCGRGCWRCRASIGRPSWPSRSSPRTRSCGWKFPPFDGRDLNPLLQDPGLAFIRRSCIWAMSG